MRGPRGSIWRRVCRSPRGVAAMLAVVLALVFFALADEAHERELFDADHAVHDAVQGWRKPALERPIRALPIWAPARSWCHSPSVSPRCSGGAAIATRCWFQSAASLPWSSKG